MPVTRDVWAGRVLLGITVWAPKEYEPPFIRDFIFGALLLDMASGLKPSIVITTEYLVSCVHTSPIKNRSRAVSSNLQLLLKNLFTNNSPFERMGNVILRLLLLSLCA